MNKNNEQQQQTTTHNNILIEKEIPKVSPMKVSEFRQLQKVGASGPKKTGRKCDWSKVDAFLSTNKELAYSVKEVHEQISKHILPEGVTISRVRVYKYLNKLVEKGKMEVREDEGGAGQYNWLHLQKETPKVSKKGKKEKKANNHPIGWGEHNAPQPIPAIKPDNK